MAPQGRCVMFDTDPLTLKCVLLWSTVYPDVINTLFAIVHFNQILKSFGIIVQLFVVFTAKASTVNKQKTIQACVTVSILLEILSNANICENFDW